MKLFNKSELLPICPVCGFDGLEETPFSEFGYPSYEICSCCGFEFGFTDESEGWTYETYRNKWIADGYPFKYVLDRPENWSPEQAAVQLRNIERVRHYTPR